MDNVRPEGTEYQPVTFTSGEDLVGNLHVRCFDSIRNSSQKYEPVFGAAREWNSDDVSI